MRYAIALFCLSVMTLGFGQGCGRLFDEGMEKGLGPGGKALPMDPKWPANDSTYLARYQNFAIGTIKTEFPDTPREFMDYLPMKLAEQLTKKDLPMNRGGKTLVINITVVVYDSVSSYNKAIKPTEEVVARVDLVDKSDGKLVGQAMCIGRTYQSISLGSKTKAEGLSKAIVNEWINKAYPKAGRREAED